MSTGKFASSVGSGLAKASTNSNTKTIALAENEEARRDPAFVAPLIAPSSYRSSTTTNAKSAIGHKLQRSKKHAHTQIQPSKSRSRSTWIALYGSSNSHSHSHSHSSHDSQNHNQNDNDNFNLSFNDAFDYSSGSWESPSTSPAAATPPVSHNSHNNSHSHGNGYSHYKKPKAKTHKVPIKRKVVTVFDSEDREKTKDKVKKAVASVQQNSSTSSHGLAEVNARANENANGNGNGNAKSSKNNNHTSSVNYNGMQKVAVSTGSSSSSPKSHAASLVTTESLDSTATTAQKTVTISKPGISMPSEPVHSSSPIHSNGNGKWKPPTNWLIVNHNPFTRHAFTMELSRSYGHHPLESLPKEVMDEMRDEVIHLKAKGALDFLKEKGKYPRYIYFGPQSYNPHLPQGSRLGPAFRYVERGNPRFPDKDTARYDAVMAIMKWEDVSFDYNIPAHVHVAAVTKLVRKPQVKELVVEKQDQPYVLVGGRMLSGGVFWGLKISKDPKRKGLLDKDLDVVLLLLDIDMELSTPGGGVHPGDLAKGPWRDYNEEQMHVVNGAMRELNLQVFGRTGSPETQSRGFDCDSERPQVAFDSLAQILIDCGAQNLKMDMCLDLDERGVRQNQFKLYKENAWFLNATGNLYLSTSLTCDEPNIFLSNLTKRFAVSDNENAPQPIFISRKDLTRGEGKLENGMFLKRWFMHSLYLNSMFHKD